MNGITEDRQKVYDDEHLHETICAMSNSCGGIIEYDGEVIDVKPLSWHKKPAVHNGHVYRRIEGENVASGAWAKSVIASDARDFSRDDFPVNCPLDDRDTEAFREAVISRHGEYRHFSRDEFLRRAGVYSGQYLTFAGALMFGDMLNVRAVLWHKGRGAETGAANIWSAYAGLLPKLTQKLSPDSSALLREGFINALLHSDYNTDTNINIYITSSPARAIIDNPGLIRGTVRNYRLKRMFHMAGITHKHSGVITLKQDMLELRTQTTIRLAGLPEAVML